MPRVIEVIHVSEPIGRGEPGDPYRTIEAYYTLDGEFLASFDDWAMERSNDHGSPPVGDTPATDR